MSSGFFSCEMSWPSCSSYSSVSTIAFSKMAGLAVTPRIPSSSTILDSSPEWMSLRPMRSSHALCPNSLSLAAGFIALPLGVGPGAFLQPFLDSSRDLLRSEPESVGDGLLGRARAEAVDPDHQAVADDPVPVEPARSLDGYQFRLGIVGNQLALGVAVPGEESLDARHGNESGLRRQPGIEESERRLRDGKLGARGDDAQLRILARLELRFHERVGTSQDLLDVSWRRPLQRRKLLAGEDEYGRPVVPLEGGRPARRDLQRIARTPELDVGDRPQRREMLDRLVGRAVLAEQHRVVGEDEDAAQLGERRDADGRPHVIAEDEEGAAVGQEEAVVGEAVDDGSHAVLAHAEMDVAAAVLAPADVALVLQVGQRRRIEVRRSADERRNQLGGLLQDRRSDLARRVRLLDGRHYLDELVGEVAGDGAARELVEDARLVGIARPPLRESLLPGLVILLQLLDAASPEGADVVGHEEGRLERPAQVLLRAPDLVLPERRAVGLVGIRLGGRAVSEHGAHRDDARPVLHRPGGGNGAIDGFDVVAVLDAQGVPAIGGVAPEPILGEGDLGVAGERNVVVVIQKDEVAEAEMAGERGGFAGDALHQIAVRADGVDGRVEGALTEPCGEHLLREREADGVGDALSQRAGGRLDAVGVAELRVARRIGMELPEPLEVVDRDLEPGEMQERIQQHRAVAG